MKIDYEKEAVKLLEEIYYTPQDQRIQLLKDRLEAAYYDGVNGDWWTTIDEDTTYNKEELDFERIKDLYKKRRWT